MGARALTHKPVQIAAVLAAWAACTGAVPAQDLTEAEITARFVAQREAIKAATTNPSLGRSRGLVLSNVAPAEEAAPGATLQAAPAPGTPSAAPLILPGATGTDVAHGGPEGLTTPAAADATPGGATMTHWTLPKDEQVNVQVTFAFDSSAIDDSQKPKLRQICGALDAAGVGVLRIVGHTDSSGPATYNQQLSVLRAEEVERFFRNECGIAPDRLQAIGVGEQFPYDANDPRAGVNRRVEFQAIS
jgi:OmpA-OmpF porin, OOP family